jgi:hypothetical protein
MSYRVPASFIESLEQFSRKRFFTSLLSERSRVTYLHYDKARLNPHYLAERERSLLRGRRVDGTHDRAVVCVRICSDEHAERRATLSDLVPISTAGLASGVYIAVAKLNKRTEVLRIVVE